MTDRVVKVSVVAEVNSYLAGMDKVAKATLQSRTDAEKLVSQLERQRQAFNVTGTAMLAAGGVVAAGLAIATKKAADFDAQMAQVKTLSGATASEMNSLRDAALHLGQGIGQSATDVADAETELVKAGISVKDQLGGALKGTLDLAAAGQMNVADATQIAASAMTQFNLVGKDVPHIADLLAAGADKALGSVSDLGQALKFVGPVAQSMGISIEQTVGSLSLLAQNGILAEQGGTELRGVLLALTAPSKLAQKAMDEYGISLYDASGKFVGINGAAEQLKKHLGNLDQATREQALGQIFGNQQITAAAILMQGGAQAVDKWTAAVNDSGFAAHQASGKMDSLNGDLKKLQAAWDSALIGIGESSQTGLRGITQSITGVLAAFNKLPDPAKDAAFGVAAVGSAIAIAGGLALIAIPKIAALKIALVELGAPAGSVSASFGSMGSALKVIPYVAAAVGIAQIGNSLADAALEASGFKKTVDGLSDSLKTMGVKKTIDDALGAFGNSTIKQMTSGGVFSDLTNQANNLQRSWTLLSPGFNQLNDAINPTRVNLEQLDKTLAQMVSRGDTKDAADAFKYLSSKTDGSKDSIDRLKSLLPNYAGALKGVKSASDNSAKSTQTAAEAYQAEADRVNGVTKAITDLVNTMNAQNDAGQKAIQTNAVWLQDLAGIADDVKQQKDAYEQSHGSLKGFTLSLDESTAVGAKNSAMLAGIAGDAQSAAKAQYDLDQKTMSGKDAADKYAATLADQRQKFIDSATAAGYSRDQVTKLADAVFQIPSAKQIQFLADTSQAEKTINSFIQSMNGRKVTLAVTANSTAVNPRGGAVAFADGGFEDHAAQIAHAGAWRVWAEPETGGEAYIPLSAAKRARSEQILAQTARLFGGQFIRGFADGGFTRPQYAQPMFTLPAVAGGGTTVRQTTNVYPAPGMSTEQVGRIAAEKTGFILKGLG